MTELGIIVYLQELFGSPAGRVFVVFIARWLVYVFVPLVVIAVCLSKGRARHAAWSRAVGALAVALFWALFVEKLVGRVRPFSVSTAVQAWIAHPVTAAFPSAHAAAAFALATALIITDKRWAWVAIPLAVLVAFGRVAAGVHYPSDVLVGAALGVGSAYLVYYFARRWKKIWH